MLIRVSPDQSHGFRDLVLHRGKDILSEDKQGGERLQDIIAKAQNSPTALAGDRRHRLFFGRRGRALH
jgi:hypothetical protein